VGTGVQLDNAADKALALAVYEDPFTHAERVSQMVTVDIFLQQKRDVWQVVAYEYQCEDDRTILDLPPPPTRTFISQQAASNYIGRVVLSRLNLVRRDAIGTDVLCQVKVLPPSEKPRPSL